MAVPRDELPPATASATTAATCAVAVIVARFREYAVHDGLKRVVNILSALRRRFDHGRADTVGVSFRFADVNSTQRRIDFDDVDLITDDDDRTSGIGFSADLVDPALQVGEGVGDGHIIYDDGGECVAAVEVGERIELLLARRIPNRQLNKTVADLQLLHAEVGADGHGRLTELIINISIEDGGFTNVLVSKKHQLHIYTVHTSNDDVSTSVITSQKSDTNPRY